MCTNYLTVQWTELVVNWLNPLLVTVSSVLAQMNKTDGRHEAELDQTSAAQTHDRTAPARLNMCEKMKKKPSDTVEKAKNALPTFTARRQNRDTFLFVCLCIYHVY